MHQRPTDSFADDVFDFVPLYGVHTLSGVALLAVALVDLSVLYRLFQQWAGQKLSTWVATRPAWLTLRRSPAC
ncbi:hypothetical protein [Leptolyngbya sp. FACHB-261]|uniref:hypothetical protein n=1 Tax=Leptolyngbya sp. FACHB-261 TaxID=2692806 RepID=UPI00168626AB|nr:hypothetical protein [Leptolyngbya sp. FACHB-261]MBD2104218.1 hypothetical protein [Leptolyngbya sp. FACHB-261]